MNLIGEGNARAPTTAIAEVAGNPDSLDLSVQGSCQQTFQVVTPFGGRIAPVMDGAAITPGIEDGRKLGCRQNGNEMLGGHEGSSLIRRRDRQSTRLISSH